MTPAMRLNRKLVLEEPVEVADGAGGVNRSWVPLGIVWADIRQLSGRELQLQELPVSAVNCRITVRATPYGAPSRPRADQRFVEGNRVYRIVAVSDIGPDLRYLVAHAREEVVQ